MRRGLHIVAALLVLLPGCEDEESPPDALTDAGPLSDGAADANGDALSGDGFAGDGLDEDATGSTSWQLSAPLSEIDGEVVDFVVDRNDVPYLLTAAGLYLQEQGSWAKIWAGNQAWPDPHSGASLDVDEDFTPRIAYRTYQQPFKLMFAWRETAGWQEEQIESAGSPFEPILLHTSERTAVVAVTHGADLYDRTLKVFEKAAGGRSAGQSITDENIDIGSTAGATIDATGQIHAVYFDNDARETIYVREGTAGSWSTEAVGAGTYLQIALSPTGAPLVFGDERPCVLALRDAGSWQEYPLPAGSVSCSFAVSSTGIAHAVFLQDEQQGVFYSTWRAGSWSVASITTEEAWKPHIALGAADQVFVVFDDATGNLRLATSAD